MKGCNYITLGGRLTADPELRYTSTDKAVCEFNLASNGFRDDDVVFIRVTSWGRTAEMVAKHMRKGDQTVVHGRVTMDRWEKDGVKRTSYGVTANDVHILQWRDSDDGPARKPEPEAETAFNGGDDEPPF